MAKILLGVTGGIAAYKAIDVANGLLKTGNEVRVIMTESAMQFINPINFSNCKVFTDKDEFQNQETVLHIDLAKWADCFVLYPCTANTIAKIVHGFADNLLTTAWLACTAKKIIFPAMNTEMLRNKVTRSNMDALGMMKDTEVMATEMGLLACGDKGPGKVIKPRNSVVAINQKINHKPSYKTILVTSGGTKAPIDDVRVVTNISSGALGATIIDDLLQNTGYNVIHIAPKMSMKSTICQVFSHRYRYYRADTVEEVQEMMQQYVPECEAVIHSMAVSDFTFDTGYATKLKSDDAEGFIEHMSTSIRRAPKIIKQIKEWSPNTMLVGFKFEVNASDEELEALAEKQMQDCGSDLVLVNDKAKMNTEKEHVAKLIGKDVQIECKGKAAIATTIREQIQEKLK